MLHQIKLSSFFFLFFFCRKGTLLKAFFRSKTVKAASMPCSKGWRMSCNVDKMDVMVDSPGVNGCQRPSLSQPGMQTQDLSSSLLTTGRQWVSSCRDDQSLLGLGNWNNRHFCGIFPLTGWTVFIRTGTRYWSWGFAGAVLSKQYRLDKYLFVSTPQNLMMKSQP